MAPRKLTKGTSHTLSNQFIIAQCNCCAAKKVIIINSSIILCEYIFKYTIRYTNNVSSCNWMLFYRLFNINQSYDDTLIVYLIMYSKMCTHSFCLYLSRAFK